MVDFIPTPNPFTLKIISKPPPHMNAIEKQIQEQQANQGVRQGETQPPVPQKLSLNELMNSESFMNKVYTCTCT